MQYILKTCSFPLDTYIYLLVHAMHSVYFIRTNEYSKPTNERALAGGRDFELRWRNNETIRSGTG